MVLCQHQKGQKDMWYKRNTGIILMLILFFPVGLYLMWRYATWHLVAKILISVGFIVAVAINVASRSPVPPNSATIAVQPPAVTKAVLAPTSAAMPTPSPLAWGTTHTFTGNGVKKTEIFTVGDNWKIKWSCDPASAYNGSYNVTITVHNANGTYKDLAINTMCNSSNTSGETEEHSGGKVYLDIAVGYVWEVTIQELV
jgi:hypothetical protein